MIGKRSDLAASIHFRGKIPGFEVHRNQQHFCLRAKVASKIRRLSVFLESLIFRRSKDRKWSQLVGRKVAKIFEKFI